MIKAVIFDMDGLLIDSEPLWREIGIRVLNEVGSSVNLENYHESMGFRTDEFVEYWLVKDNISLEKKEKLSKDIVNEVVKVINLKGRIMDGAKEIIELIQSQNIPIALASSSPMNVINTAIEKISIGDKVKIISSGEHEAYGKPHPGIFITTANKLGVKPQECLVFEDSPNGVLSAKSAKMKCVAVPEHSMKDDKRFGIADLMLHSLRDFTVEDFKKLSI